MRGVEMKKIHDPAAGSDVRQLCNDRQHQTCKYLQDLEGGELLSGSHRQNLTSTCLNKINQRYTIWRNLMMSKQMPKTYCWK